MIPHPNPERRGMNLIAGAMRPAADIQPHPQT